MEKEMINRLKIVLAEEQKSSKWLAEQLGKDRATVSKWVTNTMQPDARNLLRIAEALNIEAGRLLNQKHFWKYRKRRIHLATSHLRMLFLPSLLM